MSHTFKIDKARRELGYSPKPYSLVDSVEQYLKSRKPRSFQRLLDLPAAPSPPRHAAAGPQSAATDAVLHGLSKLNDGKRVNKLIVRQLNV